jgi:hypothetical protein
MSLPRQAKSSQARFVFESKLEQTVAAAQKKFGGDVRPMIFHGVETDPELIANFFAGEIFRDKFEDAAFGWSEFFQTWILAGQRPGACAAMKQEARERGRDERLSIRNRVDALEEVS